MQAADNTATLSSFERLAAINVNDQVEKKGGLSYLSWAWALDRLMRADPDAEWGYEEIQYMPDRTAMIYCTVSAFGKNRRAHLPIMDYKNRAIVEPNAFEINTAMQRCFVKACALHGLGLYIYAGEDLPPGEEKAANDEPAKKDPSRPNTAKQVAVDQFDEMSAADQKYLGDLAATVIDMVEGGDDAYGYLESKQLSTEMKLSLWALLPSKVRSTLQKAARPKPQPRVPMLVPELASQP